MENTNKEFYKTDWFMVLMLLVFFPVGLYLMWKDKHFNHSGRVAISVLFACMLVFTKTLW